VEPIKELRKVCQPDEIVSENAWYARKFARKVSIYITRLLLYTPINANQTTLLFIGIGFLAGLFFLTGTPILNFWGVVVLQLWYIFDHVDGEIARYRKQTSMTGMYLDYMAHYLVHPYIFFCLTWGVFSQFHNVYIFIFGFLAAFSCALVDLNDDCVYRALCVKFFKETNRKHTSFPISSSNSTSFPKRSPIKRVFGFLLRSQIALSHHPEIMNIITLAVFIDLFVSNFMIFGVKLNFVALVIIYYSVTLPLVSLFQIYATIKNRRTEVMYELLFKNKGEQC